MFLCLGGSQANFTFVSVKHVPCLDWKADASEHLLPHAFELCLCLPALRSPLAGCCFRPPLICGRRGVFNMNTPVHTVLIHLRTLCYGSRKQARIAVRLWRVSL